MEVSWFDDKFSLTTKVFEDSNDPPLSTLSQLQTQRRGRLVVNNDKVYAKSFLSSELWDCWVI